MTYDYEQTELKMMDVLRNKLLKDNLYVLEITDPNNNEIIHYYCGRGNSINSYIFTDYIFNFDVNVYVDYNTAMKILKKLNREDIHIKAL